MAVVDRDGGTPSAAELDQLLELDAATEPAPDRQTPIEWSRPALVLLAALSAGAAIIHLALAPSHFQEWAVAGAAFVVAGWLQLGLAALFVTRPYRAALCVSVAANVLFIGAWAVTRRWGWPMGPEAGVPEAASFVDITCVAFEATLVALGITLLAKPQLGAKLGQPVKVMLSAIPIAVLFLATAAIASPSAVGHSHSHGGEAAGGSGAPADHAMDHSAGPMDHGAGAMDHSHGAMDHGNGSGQNVVTDDEGLSMLKNGHHDKMVYTKLSPEDQASVDHLLAVSQEVVQKYPTLGSIKAAGGMRAGPFSPGLGSHYILPSANSFNPDGVMDETDMRNPLSVIYDGWTDEAPIAGFMYYSAAKSQPEGFAGSNDYWHFHTDVCTVKNSKGEAASVSADGNLTPEGCAQLGGVMMKETQWMVHVWSVPGYEVAEKDGGTFAEVNPKLKCPDGTYHTMKDPKDLMEHPLNACQSELGA